MATTALQMSLTSLHTLVRLVIIVLMEHDMLRNSHAQKDTTETRREERVSRIVYLAPVASIVKEQVWRHQVGLVIRASSVWEWRIPKHRVITITSPQATVCALRIQQVNPH